MRGDGRLIAMSLFTAAQFPRSRNNEFKLRPLTAADYHAAVYFILSLSAPRAHGCAERGRRRNATDAIRVICNGEGSSRSLYECTSRTSVLSNLRVSSRSPRRAPKLRLRGKSTTKLTGERDLFSVIIPRHTFRILYFSALKFMQKYITVRRDFLHATEFDSSFKIPA